MSVRKRNEHCFQVNYRVPGDPTPKTETFHTEEEALIRDMQIKLAKKARRSIPSVPGQQPEIPSCKTISEFMEEYTALYGCKMWGNSYYTSCVSLIRNYIDPYIGNETLWELNTRKLDAYYLKLLKEPAVVTPGKPTGARITAHTVQRIHRLLRSALEKAVAWDYIPKNPALGATLPVCRSEVRTVWSDDEALKALRCCQDDALQTCLYLALGCSMRLGEILGLQWKNVHVEPERIAAGEAFIRVDRELKRVSTQSIKALKAVNRSGILFQFPKVVKKPATTTLVLKQPKTESSNRLIYLPSAVAEELLRVKNVQRGYQEFLGDEYQDFDLVVAQVGGRPFEIHMIDKKFEKLIEDNHLLPCVFHSLRHCSTSLKLKFSQGNIKAVQGDTGHAEARMVTDTYAHSFDFDRKNLAKEMDTEFFSKVLPDHSVPVDEVAAIKAMIDRNPELVRELLMEFT